MKNKLLIAIPLIISAVVMSFSISRSKLSKNEGSNPRGTEDKTSRPEKLSTKIVLSPNPNTNSYSQKIELAKNLAPSLEEMGKNYESIDDQKALEAEYNRSMKILSDLKLIQKANEQKLNDEELIIFTTELRKQGIIGVRLAELELKKHEDLLRN